MSKLNLQTVRLALEAKRKELQSGAFDRSEILIENVADEFERLQQQLNREVAVRNIDRQSKLLKDVQAAIARTADGTFGMCLHCEEPIPEKRLKAVPWARYCVPCQEEMECHQPAGGTGDRGREELAA